MFCSVCGSEISLAAEVCPSCGRTIAATNTRTLTRIGAASAARKADGAASRASGASGSWARPLATLTAPDALPAPTSLPALDASATNAASIFAGDLDEPGFPRDLPSRVALLTGLVMAADLLLPWVSMNGVTYAPSQVGLPTLALLVALLAVIAPPLLPRWRRTPIARMLPFGVGALMLGFAGALWVFSGPLAATLAARLTIALPQMAPALGLYVFLLGAGALTLAGYQLLAAQSQRPRD